MKSISERGNKEKHSPIRKLVDSALRRKEEGIEPYFLNIGQPDLKAPEIFLNYLKELKTAKVPYSHAQGDLELREVWASYYRRRGQNIKKDDLLVTIGGSEAIVLALTLVADPGDEVLTLSPFYPNYMSFAKQSGVVLNSVKRTIENGFHLPSIEEIEKKINSKTRALLFSNPCNPTGVVFYKEEIEALIDLCEKHDLFLISDEVYYEISFKHQTTSALDFLKGASRVIVVDSVSKKFSLCGTRIGALISRNPLIVAAGTSYASARLSAPTLEQKALIPLFKEAEKVIAPIVKTFSKRNKNLYQRIKKIQGVEAYEAEGALYLFCQLPVISSSNFCRWLVEEYAYKGHTVVLAPGYGFYQDYSEGCSKIRIANVLDTELLLESMTIIEKGLEVYPDY